MVRSLFWCSLVIFLCNESHSKVIQDDDKFTFIRNTSIFIDKTFLIKKILQHDRILITAPRKFGKTTNLQMVKLFLGNHNRGYAETFFQNTNIWRDKQLVEKHFCNHPVIWCSLKPQGAKTLKEIANDLRKNVQKAYEEHRYLGKSTKLNKAAKKRFSDYVNAEVTDYSRGLRFLSDLLHSHHGKKAIILIDDFDHLLTQSIFSKDLDLNKIARAVFHIVNETINQNEHLEQAIFTGSVPFKSSMNLLQSFKFMESKDFSPYFGFTESETEYLLDKFRLGRYKSEVSKWYGGYNYVKGTFQIYNPWSVLMFLKTKQLGAHWVNENVEKALLNYVKPHFRLHRFIRALAKGQNITIDSTPSFTFKEITKLKQLQLTYSKVKEDYDLFVQLFLETGYLTYAKPYRVVPGSVSIKAPNKEISDVFGKIAKQLPVPDFSKIKSKGATQGFRGRYGRPRRPSYQ